MTNSYLIANRRFRIIWDVINLTLLFIIFMIEFQKYFISGMTVYNGYSYINLQFHFVYPESITIPEEDVFPGWITPVQTSNHNWPIYISILLYK
jgi:hypothetical protein